MNQYNIITHSFLCTRVTVILVRLLLFSHAVLLTNVQQDINMSPLCCPAVLLPGSVLLTAGCGSRFFFFFYARHASACFR